MRRLKMSWNTEGGRLVCRWIEWKECEEWGPFWIGDQLRLSCNSLVTGSTRARTELND